MVQKWFGSLVRCCEMTFPWTWGIRVLFKSLRKTYSNSCSMVTQMYKEALFFLSFFFCFLFLSPHSFHFFLLFPFFIKKYTQKYLWNTKKLLGFSVLSGGWMYFFLRGVSSMIPDLGLLGLFLVYSALESDVYYLLFIHLSV